MQIRIWIATYHIDELMFYEPGIGHLILDNLLWQEEMIFRH